MICRVTAEEGNRPVPNEVESRDRLGPLGSVAVLILDALCKYFTIGLTESTNSLRTSRLAHNHLTATYYLYLVCKASRFQPS